ncbi:MAG TPA: HAD family hydrolase [Nevskiaceae bacterium]|nr:HAD family hydrolase [Nevskiaceae bacterium]
MRLAVFDLDHTLLAGDSDYLWGQFLVEQGLVDGEAYARENERYYKAYLDGTLDIAAFAAFSLAPIVKHGADRLAALRPRFVHEKIEPIVAPGTAHLLERHRAQGDQLLITTATSRFITEPIAKLLGIDVLLATNPEVIDSRYTGRIAGTANFREGKLINLKAWQGDRRYSGMSVYSDSHNDLPLLEAADQPVAVDPDDRLRAHAQSRSWPIISLRDLKSVVLAE